MTDDTLDAMIKYGGSFVKKLAELTQAADAQNRRRLMDAFPDYFSEYRKIAEQELRSGTRSPRTDP